MQFFIPIATRALKTAPTSLKRFFASEINLKLSK